MLRVVRGVTWVLVVGAVAGCGQQGTTPATRLSCAEYREFSATQDLSGGGSPSPEEAAAKLSESSALPFAVPGSGWVTLGSPGPDAEAVTLRSGDVQVEAIRAKDGTWLIDGARACA
jgi:hypothetical protein